MIKVIVLSPHTLSIASIIIQTEWTSTDKVRQELSTVTLDRNLQENGFKNILCKISKI